MNHFVFYHSAKALIVFCVALLVSCADPVNDITGREESSSSVEAGFVQCSVGGGACVEMAKADCAALAAKGLAQVCGEELLASSSSVSSSSSEVPSSSSYVPQGGVKYGNKTYKTVVITKDSYSQVWMAENLAYNPSANARICDASYGCYYTWSQAMNIDSKFNSAAAGMVEGIVHQGICPENWHLPSDAEWMALANAIGSDAGTKLKSTSWDGEDTYGFSALPGGGYSGSSFYRQESYGSWWSAVENGAGIAYGMYMVSGDSYMNLGTQDAKRDGRSVRCVKD
jgi:uncharacterized protein (TIGR02145 family)